MNFKKYHVSKNLANLYNVDKTSLDLRFTTDNNMTIKINGVKASGKNVISLVYPGITLPAGTYTVMIKMISGTISGLTDGVFFGINENTYSQRTTPGILQVGDVGVRTFTLSNDTVLSSIDIAPGYDSYGSVFTDAVFECMLVSGSYTAQTMPSYEPYSSEVWHEIPYYIHNTSTDTITTLPAVIYPNAATATVGLKGNMQQSGTPTPQNPVMPESCGGWDNEPAGINKLSQREYTDADGVSNESSTNPSTIKITYANKTTVPAIPSDVSSESEYQQWFTARTTYVGDDRKDYTADDRPCDYEHCQFFGNLKAGSYKLVCEAYVNTDRYPWVLRTHDNQNPYIALLTEDNQILVKKSMNQPYAPTVDDPLFNGYYTSATKFYHEEYPFTVSADTSVGFISKIYAQYNGNVHTRFQIVDADVVAKPFTNTTYNISGVTCWEPYKDPPGYKLDISSASTTTPVYLGEVETTRRVKKYVLTGSEGGAWCHNITIRSGNGFYNPNIFTEYKPNVGAGYCTHYPLATATTDTIGVFFGGNINFITDFAEGIDTADKWKTYLQQQYAAGTPVTVWYVLSSATTGIVNEPLRKIGEYADEVSNVSIPVTAGGDTISVGATLQPSEVTVNYKGWHPAIAHERENGAWT